MLSALQIIYRFLPPLEGSERCTVNIDERKLEGCIYCNKQMHTLLLLLKKKRTLRIFSLLTYSILPLPYWVLRWLILLPTCFCVLAWFMHTHSNNSAWSESYISDKCQSQQWWRRRREHMIIFYYILKMRPSWALWSSVQLLSGLLRFQSKVNGLFWPGEHKISKGLDPSPLK